MQFKEKEEIQSYERNQRGQGQNRGRGCGRCWNYNYNNFNNYEKGESSTRGRGRNNLNTRYDKSKVRCYNCQKFGHYASACRAYNNEVEEKANYVEEKNQGDETVLLAYKDNNEGQENTWYLDTGANNHICGKRSMFVELDESTNGNVSFGDDSKVVVKGKGNILIQLKDGRHQFIGNVYYMPNMKSNILSLGQLLEKGYDIHMKDYSLFIRDDKGNLITKVKMSKNRMFSLNIQNDIAKCLKAYYKDASWLWHLRFGHLNFGGLELLAKKKMQKSKVFRVFKKFKASIEKESGRQIKAMRTDRGGEFTSKEFQEFCEANGIRRFLTVRRSPQQNGVAERKNRIVLNIARSMLKSKRLPKEFWAEVVSTAVYLSNRSPTRSVWEKTPQEAWCGRKPGISHLRVFGNVAHAHVPDKRRTKLDDKSESFIFIGCDSSSKGYKLYNPNNNKIVMSRDVIFDEEGEWNFGLDVDDFNFFPLFEEEPIIE
ncbi:Retrovirus-related Pol polyprotein from transposon TNT 1-94 [Melia azedarach]|uniref:Retrovirus-related Pol polyprotein from transposon TNT 1-94 n=1 Tax=Melia azedarach TaxID=155640 RepID=A0ACC1YYL7_MELAZ|nr:Retrovirus-related Pol polyprotein from transposon TNT 1-94 [Melia azedarach]